MDNDIYIDHSEEIDIKDLLLSIKKHLVLIIILPLIFSGIAFGIRSYLVKPVYQASVSIIISKNSGGEITQSDVSLYQSLIKSYTVIAKSYVVAERAVRDGNLQTSAEALQASSVVSYKEGTQVLYMSVVSGDPQDAVIKVEALAQAFLQESKRLLSSGNINVLDHAKLPTSTVNSNNPFYILVTFAIGLLTTIVIALLIEKKKDTMKSLEYVEKNFEIPILGVIPRNI